MPGDFSKQSVNLLLTVTGKERNGCGLKNSKQKIPWFINLINESKDGIFPNSCSLGVIVKSFRNLEDFYRPKKLIFF